MDRRQQWRRNTHQVAIQPESGRGGLRWLDGHLHDAERRELPGKASYTVTDLTNGTAYRFKIRAVNGIGDGAESDESASVTPSTTPEKPTNLMVSGGVESVSLTWTAGGNGGSAITSWKYQQKNGSNDWGDWSAVLSSGASTTSHTVTGLTSVVSYKFKVRAVNANGDGAESDGSSSVSPTAATLTASSVGGDHRDADRRQPHQRLALPNTRRRPAAPVPPLPLPARPKTLRSWLPAPPTHSRRTPTAAATRNWRRRRRFSPCLARPRA